MLNPYVGAGPSARLAKFVTMEFVDEAGKVRRHERKKFFKSDEECVFCSKKGHSLRFCPCLPSEPTKENRHTFVEALVGVPKWKLKMYEGMSMATALAKVCEMGAVLNEGNPWRDRFLRSEGG
jgi:hypothetical protein